MPLTTWSPLGGAYRSPAIETEYPPDFSGTSVKINCFTPFGLARRGCTFGRKDKHRKTRSLLELLEVYGLIVTIGYARVFEASTNSSDIDPYHN